MHSISSHIETISRLTFQLGQSHVHVQGVSTIGRLA